MKLYVDEYLCFCNVQNGSLIHVLMSVFTITECCCITRGGVRENVPSYMCVQQALYWACPAAQFDQSSLSTWRSFASLAIQNAPSEDTDQTAWMRRLIRIFAGQTYQNVLFLTLRLRLFIRGKWPSAQRNLQKDLWNTEYLDQSAHPHSLHRVFTEIVPSTASRLSKMDKREPLPYWLDIQADLRLLSTQVFL